MVSVNQDASQLPPPTTEGLALSRTLAERIRDEIDAAGGWISFERYMQLALYEPGLGYYSAGAAKFGAAGDFVTAPELSGTLASALVAQLAPMLARLQAPVLLELGAGLGTLADQLLAAFRDAGSPPVSYRILEPSADLAARQRQTLASWGSQVSWLDSLPETPFEGIILANEVVDALPAACFVKRTGRAWPVGVAQHGDGFTWAEGPEDTALGDRVVAVEKSLGRTLPDGYRSEIRLRQSGWIEALGHGLQRGAICLVDYGHSRHDYYHPERSSGTLVAHYRHRVLDDPFFLPGLVDLTAWVDFSALAVAAEAAGLALATYTTQGQFLLESIGVGLVEPGTTLQALSALKTLLLPGEMGERFKLMVLSKDFDVPLWPGRDFRDRLDYHS